MNYLKKKIKGHKKGHDDDDDFDFEPAPAHGGEHQSPKPNLEKDSEEWKFFQQLTQRVQDTVQKSQTTLEKLRDTSAVEEISKPDYDFIDDPAITKVVPPKSASWVDFDEGLKKQNDNLISTDQPSTPLGGAGSAPAVKGDGKAPPPRPPPPRSAKSEDSESNFTDETRQTPQEGVEGEFDLLDEFGFRAEPQPAVISAVVEGLLILDEAELEDDPIDDKDDPFDTSFVNEKVAVSSANVDFLSSDTGSGVVLTPTSTPDNKGAKTSAQSIFEASQSSFILDPLDNSFQEVEEDAGPDPFDTSFVNDLNTPTLSANKGETKKAPNFNEDPFGEDPFSCKLSADSLLFASSAKPVEVKPGEISKKSSADNLLFGGAESVLEPARVELDLDLEEEDAGPDPFDTSFVYDLKTSNSTSGSAVQADAEVSDPFGQVSKNGSGDNFLFETEGKEELEEERQGKGQDQGQREVEEEEMSNPFLTDTTDVSPPIPKFPTGRRRSTNPFEDDILEQASDLLASSFAETALAASNLTAEITNFATENAKLFDQLETKTGAVGMSTLGDLILDDHDGPSSSLPFGSPPSATEPSKPSTLGTNIFDVFGSPSPDPSPSVPVSVSPITDLHRKLSGDAQFGKIDTADLFGLGDPLPVETKPSPFQAEELFGFGALDNRRTSETKETDNASSLWLGDDTTTVKEEDDDDEESASEPYSIPHISDTSTRKESVSQVISSLEKIASFAADDLDDKPPPATLMGTDFNLPIAEVDEPSSIGEYPSLSPPEKIDDHPVGDLFDSFSMGSHYVAETGSRKNSETVNPFGDAAFTNEMENKTEPDFNFGTKMVSPPKAAPIEKSAFDQAFDSLASTPSKDPFGDKSITPQPMSASTFDGSKLGQTFDSLGSSKDPFDFNSSTSKTSTFDGSKFDEAFGGSTKNKTTSGKDPFDLLGGDGVMDSQTSGGNADPFGFEPIKDSVPITDTAAFEAFAAKFEQVIEKYDTGTEPDSLSVGDAFDPFGTPSSAPSAGESVKSTGFDVVDMFDPFLSMTKPPENTPIKIPEPSSEPMTRKMPSKQPSKDSFDDDDDVDFTVVIRPKMIDKSDAPVASLEPPPLLPPPPKSPMKDPREQNSTPASRFNPFNKDFGFSLDVGRKEEPSVNLLASPTNESEPPPALGEAGVKKSGDTPESPRTPLFDEDTSQPLEEFPPKLDIEGWDLMLRQPSKKKITGNRYWKKVYVKLSENSILQLFNKKEDNDPFQELPLQACYSLSEIGAQQYDAYGKIFTVKFNYTFYRERMGVRPGQISKVMHGQITSVGQIAKLGLPLEHAPQVSQLLKLGSQTYNDVKTFVQIMEDALFRLPVHRDRALTYKTEEIQLAVHDELYVEQRRDGHIEKQNARVRVFFLAFISGMPSVEVGLNDLLREGKEVVGRYDIIPVVTEEWIRLENWEFHSCVVQEEFENTRIVKLHPPDACLFELMRFRIRPPKNRELPLQVKCSMRITSMRVEMRADVLVPGYHSRKHGQVPCEDIQIRFPLPECWIYLFRVEKHFRYGSLKSAARKPGKIKGLERIMGAAQTLDTSLIEVSTGQAKYEHSFKSVVWRIPRLPKEGQGAYTTQLFLLRLDLTSFDQIPETFERYIFVQFTMPATTVSHTTVRSVSVTNENPPEKYVKYAAKHEYRIEIDMSQGGEENEYTSAVTSAINAANPQFPSDVSESTKISGSCHEEEDEDDSD